MEGMLRGEGKDSEHLFSEEMMVALSICDTELEKFTFVSSGSKSKFLQSFKDLFQVF